MDLEIHKGLITNKKLLSDLIEKENGYILDTAVYYEPCWDSVRGKMLF